MTTPTTTDCPSEEAAWEAALPGLAERLTGAGLCALPAGSVLLITPVGGEGLVRGEVTLAERWDDQSGAHYYAVEGHVRLLRAATTRDLPLLAAVLGPLYSVVEQATAFGQSIGRRTTR